MEVAEYQGLVRFLSSGCTEFPDNLLQKSNKADRNKRDNYKIKARKFFLKGNPKSSGIHSIFNMSMKVLSLLLLNGQELHRIIPGTLDGTKVVTSEELNDILAEFHGSAFGGHSGVNRTIIAIRARYWWHGLTDDVKNYIRSCEACQKPGRLKLKPEPDLQPIKVSYPFELVRVDLFGPMVTTEQGNKYIFTATDYFTKWVEAFPVPSKSATDVVKCFRKLFARHGAVNAVITDQDEWFVNQVNDQLYQEWNVRNIVRSANLRHGLDERTSQTLKATLRKMVNEHQDNWEDFLDRVLFAQRTKPESTTKYSPFFLLYGREAVYPSQLPKHIGGSDRQPVESPELCLESYIGQRQQTEPSIRERVMVNVQKAQDRKKKEKQPTGNRKSCNPFAVGDLVLVRNSRKAATKKKVSVASNHGCPYAVKNHTGKQETVPNSFGLVLKKTVSPDKLIVLKGSTQPPITREQSTMEQVTMEQATATELADNTDKQTDMMNKARDYLKEIVRDLEQLINFTRQIYRGTSTVVNLSHLVMTCPLQSFIAEVSRESKAEVDAFSSQILSLIRHLDISLKEKTTLTMLMSSVCVTAAKLFQPVMMVAETLKEKPSHLWDTSPHATLPPSQRLSVGGESLEGGDLASLDQGKFLNDKVVNSFLGLLKSRHNLTSSKDHVFVLPSYTAVFWNMGNLDHWMFKKVQFSKFKHILMPINVNRNHWVLMVVNIVERTVAVLDSMNGQNAGRWVDLWRKFMEKRESLTDMAEMMGPWQQVHASCSRQSDGNSCGIFTLMNAECIIKGVPVHVMRQVHCNMYRNYVRDCLLERGTTKDEKTCDLPNCSKEPGVNRWVQCCVCGRWFHTKCCGLTTKSTIQYEFECCVCNAMYR